MILDKINDAFGYDIDIFTPAMFYSWKHALRFELGCSGTYVQMFTQAMQRCGTISRYLFRNSSKVNVLLRLWEYQDSRSRHKENLRNLIKCGFKLPRNYEKEIVKQIEPIDRDCTENPEFWHEHLYLFEVSIDDQNALAIMWAILSFDIGIRPTAEISAHFIDLQNKIIMHPYDDRGMDIVATEKDKLLDTYNTFHNWLLDYDLERMKETFE